MVLLAFIAYHYEYVGTEEKSVNDDIVEEVSNSVSSSTAHIQLSPVCPETSHKPWILILQRYSKFQDWYDYQLQ